MRRLWSLRAHSLVFPLILSACVWISPSPSPGSRCCASLPAAKSSALFRCLAPSQEEEGGDGGSGGSMGGFSGGSRVHITFHTRRSTRAPCLYTHKSACHFYCLLLCSQGDVFSLLVPSPSFFFFFSFLPSASSPPLHLRETSRGFAPPPSTPLLALSGPRRQARMFGNGHLE